MAGDWDFYKIGHLCNFSQGLQVPVKKQNTLRGEKQVRFLRLSDYTKGDSDIRYIDAPNQKYWCQKNDVVMMRYGDAGRVVRGKSGVIANNLFKINPNSDNLDQDYLYWVLNRDEVYRYLRAQNTSSGLPAINFRDLKEIEIPLPPLAEQKRIAHLLGSLDDKIELNRKMNETLEEMAQAIFKSWFIDFDGVPTEDLVDSELGLIPKGWEVKTIENVAEKIIDCLHSKKPEAQTSGTLMLQVYNIGSTGRLIYNKKYFVTEEDHNKWCSRITPKFGDIFISKTGRVGAIGQLLSNEKCSFGRNLVALRPNPKIFPIHAFRLLMLSKHMKGEISRLTTDGTILKSIHVKHIKKLRAIVPPMSLLSKLEKIVEPISLKMAINDKESQTLSELRDTLLPKLISGEIRIPEAEEQVEQQLSLFSEEGAT